MTWFCPIVGCSEIPHAGWDACWDGRCPPPLVIWSMSLSLSFVRNDGKDLIDENFCFCGGTIAHWVGIMESTHIECSNLAICWSTRSFARTAHLFVGFTLIDALARSTVLICLLAHSLACSLAHEKEFLVHNMNVPISYTFNPLCFQPDVDSGKTYPARYLRKFLIKTER